MTRTLMTATCLLALLPMVSGCKIVKNPDPNDAEHAAAQMTDEERMAALVAEVYEPKLLPYMDEKAQEIGAVLPAIASDLNAAGESLGIPKASEGSPWNFVAKGEGVVIASNRESRAAKLEVDVNGDNEADLSIQLGPVIKGTALRDATSFFVFTDFRDQIEFAKLARALNDQAGAAIEIPEGDLVGQTVSFTGAFSLPRQSDAILLVPVHLAVGG
ncbi:DUF2291 family protein [Aliiruegeria sabulilitoris]|uniref:DUF2291 family protein n=1 Tax=Aliiruegeria sabulilitoris TaxID=1510458 RepID=UPI000A98C2CE|nr:DUF2291 domain-containing protein [Aliiruegeria sabulilitoris]NDR57845.1 DUF2291 domain-containing protein [Pseudoruegeria sp. M32A2M]